MSDGACCHYCNRYECECPDEPAPKTMTTEKVIKTLERLKDYTTFENQDIALDLAIAALTAKSDIPELSKYAMPPDQVIEILGYIETTIMRGQPEEVPNRMTALEHAQDMIRDMVKLLTVKSDAELIAWAFVDGVVYYSRDFGYWTIELTGRDPIILGDTESPALTPEARAILEAAMGGESE